MTKRYTQALQIRLVSSVNPERRHQRLAPSAQGMQRTNVVGVELVYAPNAQTGRDLERPHGRWAGLFEFPLGNVIDQN